MTLLLTSHRRFIPTHQVREGCCTSPGGSRHSLTKWSLDWHMKFNPSKCSLLRITNNVAASRRSTIWWGLISNRLEIVEFSSKMDWGQHINKVTSKAQRSLNFLQRNLYKCPEDIKQQTSLYFHCKINLRVLLHSVGSLLPEAHFSPRISAEESSPLCERELPA